jgi:hypothetical protein
VLAIVDVIARAHGARRTPLTGTEAPTCGLSFRGRSGGSGRSHPLAPSSGVTDVVTLLVLFPDTGSGVQAAPVVEDHRGDGA